MCEFCGATIRKEKVLVGRHADQVAHLWIDRWPHSDGRVILRDDGHLRLLHPKRRSPPGVTHRYRVHSKRECATVEDGGA